MAEQQLSINLRMISVPMDPAKAAPVAATAPRKQTATFNVGRLLAQLSILGFVAALSVGAYLLISQYLVQSIEVVGESMVPTLAPGNHYILNRWAYHSAAPKHGDIVVIRDPADHGFSVKRIIAVEGESVHFRDGKVFVNSEVLKETYFAPHTMTFTYSQAKEQFISCGADQYYVLGDNRLASVDSRAYGTVQRKDVLGQVVIK